MTLHPSRFLPLLLTLATACESKSLGDTAQLGGRDLCEVWGIKVARHESCTQSQKSYIRMCEDAQTEHADLGCMDEHIDLLWCEAEGETEYECSGSGEPSPTSETADDCSYEQDALSSCLE